MIKRVPYCTGECGISEICHQRNAEEGFCLHPQKREDALMEEQRELRIMQIPVIHNPTLEFDGSLSLLDASMTMLLIGNLKRISLDALLNLQYALQDLKRLHRLPSHDTRLLGYIRVEAERRIAESRNQRDNSLDGMGRLMD